MDSLINGKKSLLPAYFDCDLIYTFVCFLSGSIFCWKVYYFTFAESRVTYQLLHLYLLSQDNPSGVGQRCREIPTVVERKCCHQYLENVSLPHMEAFIFTFTHIAKDFATYKWGTIQPKNGFHIYITVCVCVNIYLKEISIIIWFMNLWTTRKPPHSAVTDLKQHWDAHTSGGK